MGLNSAALGLPCHSRLTSNISQRAITTGDIQRLLALVVLYLFSTQTVAGIRQLIAGLINL